MHFFKKKKIEYQVITNLKNIFFIYSLLYFRGIAIECVTDFQWFPSPWTRRCNYIIIYRGK